MVSVNDVLKDILARFESGEIPEAIAFSTFPAPDMPSARWSLLNRTIVFMAGTTDARGFRQWQEINRRVKKGAKALYILVPRIINQENDEGEQRTIVAGFLVKPVFRLEDTEGDPVQYSQPILPDLPLIEKAREWGISVKAIPGNYRYYGYFSESRNEIALASKEEAIFFHEVSHAAHARLYGSNKSRPEWINEIVAELSAAVLCQVVGKTSKYLGSNFKYIKHYADRAGHSPLQACLKVISDVEKILELILLDQGPPAPNTASEPYEKQPISSPAYAGGEEV